MPDLTLAQRHERIGRLLDEMQRVCDQTTPGPWKADGYYIVDSTDLELAGCETSAAPEFIAASRTWLPALLAFARSEWDVIGTDVAHYQELVRLGIKGRILRDAGERAETPLARLESALAPLLEDK